jgi:hypothetical protein
LAALGLTISNELSGMKSSLIFLLHDVIGNRAAQHVAGMFQALASALSRGSTENIVAVTNKDLMLQSKNTLE